MKGINLGKIINNNIFILKYVFKTIPIFAICNVLLEMCFGFLDVLWGTAIMKLILDAVQYNHSFRKIVIVMALYVFYGCVIQTCAAFLYEVKGPQAFQKLNYKMQIELFKKRQTLT